MFKEILKDVWPILENVSPMIANLLGAPMLSTPVLGALNMLAEKFGLEDGNIARLPQVMQSDPQCETKLQQIEDILANANFKMPSNIEFNFKASWA